MSNNQTISTPINPEIIFAFMRQTSEGNTVFVVSEKSPGEIRVNIASPLPRDGFTSIKSDEDVRSASVLNRVMESGYELTQPEARLVVEVLLHLTCF
jgi:hypothetical protein